MDKGDKTKKDQVVWPKDGSDYEIKTSIKRTEDFGVFRAYCPKVRKRCTIKKIIISDPHGTYLKELELRIAVINKFPHHSINKCFTMFETDGNYWLVMNDYKYTLADIIKFEGIADGLNVFEIVTIIGPIFRTLAYLHNDGLYHGHVSPDLILFSNDLVMLGGFEDGFKNGPLLLNNKKELYDKQRQDVIDLLIILMMMIKIQYKADGLSTEVEQICSERDISRMCLCLSDMLKGLKETGKSSFERDLNLESAQVMERIAELIAKDDKLFVYSAEEGEKGSGSARLDDMNKSDDIENNRFQTGTPPSMPLSTRIVMEWKKTENTYQYGSSESQVTTPPTSASSVSPTMFELPSSTTGMVSPPSSITSLMLEKPGCVTSAQLSALKEPMCLASSSMARSTSGSTPTSDTQMTSVPMNPPLANLRTRIITVEPTAQTPLMDRSCVQSGNDLASSTCTSVVINGGKGEAIQDLVPAITNSATEDSKQQTGDNSGKPVNRSKGFFRSRSSQRTKTGEAPGFKTVLTNIVKRVKEGIKGRRLKKDQEEKEPQTISRVGSKFQVQVSCCGSATGRQDPRAQCVVQQRAHQENKKDCIVIKMGSPCCSPSPRVKLEDQQQQQQQRLPSSKVFSVSSTKSLHRDHSTNGFHVDEDETGTNLKTTQRTTAAVSQQADQPKSPAKVEKSASSIIVVDTKNSNTQESTQPQSATHKPLSSRKSIMVATVRSMANNHNGQSQMCPQTCNQPTACRCPPSCGSENQPVSSIPSSKNIAGEQGKKKGRFVIQASNVNGLNPQSVQSCIVAPTGSATSSFQSASVGTAEIRSFGVGLDAVQSCNALVSRIGRLKHELSVLREENSRLLFLYRDLRSRVEEDSASGRE